MKPTDSESSEMDPSAEEVVEPTKKEKKKVVKLDALKVHYAKKGYTYESDGYARNDDAPESQSRYMKRLFFTWLNPLMRIGNVSTITQLDLPKLREKERSHNAFRRWKAAWQKEIDRNTGPDGTLQHYYDKKTNTYDYYSYKNISIIRIFTNFWAPDIWYSVPLKLSYDLMNYVQPLLMSAQITWITKYQDGEWPLWYGWGLTVAFLIITVNMSFLLQQYFFNQTRVALWSKSAVVQAIYRKSLVLAGPSFIGRMDVEGLHFDQTKDGKTDGAAINIVTADTAYITNLMPYIHNYWSCTLQIIMAIGLLYFNMGWPAFLGIPVLVLALPCTYFLGKLSIKYQTRNASLRDVRLGAVNESLQSIKIVKMYGWEHSVVDRVQEMRDVELKAVRRMLISISMTSFLWTVVPALVMAASFGTYLGTQGNLDPATAFTAISLFNMLRFPLVMIPTLINNGIQAYNAMTRIKQFLIAPELEDVSKFGKPDNEKYAIQCKHDKVHLYHYDQLGSIKNVLSNELSVELKEKVVIVGRVACGKTSFLKSYLGEMRLVSDKINFSTTERPSVEVLQGSLLNARHTLGINGSIAYIPQQSWVMSSTIRENIILNKPYDSARYRKVLKACQLVPELTIMVNGDLTEIGEKGVNLSGGQKQRINIARAVYQDADIYIFDDILSALDPHVGSSIMNDVIREMLSEKTVVMVTHNTKILTHFDRVIFIDEDQIRYCGPYNNTLKDDPNFQNYTAEIAEVLASMEEEEDHEINTIEQVFDVDGDGVAEDIEVEVKIDENESAILDRILRGNEKDIITQLRDDMVKEEKVSKSDYHYYFQSYKYGILAMVVIFQLCQATFTFGASWFVSYWTTELTDRMWMGYSVYLVALLVGAVFASLSPFANSFGAINAAKKHHNVTFYQILCAPMSFFDSVPTGRLINIFSKEMTNVDVLLPYAFTSALYMVIQVTGTIIMIVIGIPWFGLAFIPIMAIYIKVLTYFVPPSRQLKRIESKGNAPVITHLSTSIDGANCIRAYGLTDHFLQMTEIRVDYSLQSTNALNGSYRWLSARLEQLGAFIVVMTSMVANLTVDVLDGGSVGLALSYAITSSQMLSWTVRQCVELENAAVSIERVKQYMELEEQEPPFIVDNNRVGANWPSEGRIEFKNVHMRYKDGLPLVLKGVNVKIEPGSRVGVVGRTGAGKSTMFGTLLRLTPICEGKIEVDGVDIYKIGLHDLRHNISIIPQDPVMFKGSLRYNVDPMGTSTDAEVVDSLYKAHLKSLFEQQANSDLNFQIDEAGKNLSTGQRQLVCVARAVLRNSRIILLDEATSSVDPETDALLQATVREQFKNKTIMTIAHRVNTIMDYDVILVISEGIIAEQGNPQDLLADPNSMFFKVASAMEH